MRMIVLALVILSGGPAAAVEGVVDCVAFKDAWRKALVRAELARAPAFGAADGKGAEPVKGLVGTEASAACRGGLLSHLELRSAEARAFERTAVTILQAMDRDMAQDAAAAIVAALRAETRGGTKLAGGSWGPYDLTLNAPPGAPEELVLDLPEN